MKIKTDPKKVRAFSEYVSGFSKKVNAECNEIGSAVARLSKRTKEDEGTQIKAVTNNIQRVLNESENDLNELAAVIEKHAAIVEVLKGKKDSD